MGLRDIETNLPPGFRFYPSDEELVCHYLYKKVSNERVTEGTMVEVDLHSCEPWELPEVAKLSENEWYFFSFKDRKYATGSRANRATKSGYWKATGKDRMVCDPSSHEIVGMRKTLVFYRGRAPNGIKSSWVMHEFRLENPHSPPKEDWVLCRVFHKRKGEEEINMSSSPPPLMAEHHPLQEEGSYGGTSLFSSGPHHETSNNYNHSSSQPFTDDMASFNFLHHSFLDFPPQMEVEVGFTCGETAGFLLDLVFEDEHGMECRFEGSRDGLY